MMIMKRWTTVLLAAVLLAGCGRHYQVVSVERTRTLIDNRYDARLNPATESWLAPYRAEVEKQSAPVVGHAGMYMEADRPEAPLSNLLPDILMWAAAEYGEKPDFAVYNIGGMRAALSKGAVTVGDVNEVAPFDNKICFVTLSGDAVTELFAQIAGRGGEGLSHGVELSIGRNGALLNARLNGEPIDPKRDYRIATIDYLLPGADGMVAFKKSRQLNAPNEEKNNTRFVIMDYFRYMEKLGKPVTAKVEGRVRIVENGK